ncbi:MAG: hypothetical protein Q7J82_06555 [Coriobacteriia bacterium]|nr:hypothetical protein [Coriobacteriia bacterium]
MDVFRPKRSLGWVWALGLALFVAATLVLVPVMAYLEPEEEAVPLLVCVMFLVIDVPLFVLFAAIAVFFPAMRYEFGADQLVLSYGPILRYRIPYTDVRAIRQEDLRAQLWSSMRWPGLALYKVPYSKLGSVRMCSTRMNRGDEPRRWAAWQNRVSESANILRPDATQTKGAGNGQVQSGFPS